MENEVMTIDFTDIKNYWMTLFPEVKTEHEFDEILKNVSDTNLKDLECEIDKQSPLDENDCCYDKFFLCEEIPLLKRFSTKFENDFVFLNYFKPILNYHLIWYYEKLNELKIINNVDEFCISSMNAILNTISSISQRALILEVNIARINNILCGETPKERFHYFTNQLLLNSDFLKELYYGYSELTNIINLKIKQYFDYILQIINNTQNESDNLSKKLNNKKPIGKIEKIITEMGDTHRGGKSVAIIDFDTQLRLVYKPRTLDLEYGFKLICEWLNTRITNKMLDLKTASVYTKDDFGWMEFIENNQCETYKQIGNYYTRTGELLAVLYSLNAKDFHHENLIAHSEFPMPIDLESLFHSNIQIDDPFFSGSFLIAKDLLNKSVYSIGLLPMRITSRIDNNDISVELSGLGAEDKQVAPFKSFFIDNRDCDNIMITKKLSTVMPQKNNPKIGGTIQKSDLYTYEIKDGFEKMYNLIMNNKMEYINKLIELFSGKKTRFILRPTYLYGQLLRTSYHPDFLTQSIHRRILLHRIGIKANDKIKDLLKSEFQDMLLGDIPYFNAVVDKDILLDSKQNEFKNFFNASLLADVKEKIHSFCQADIDRQLHIIDMTFLAKNNDTKKDITNIQFSNIHYYQKKLKTKEWLRLAEHIGEYIIQNSIEGKDDITWISTLLEGREELTWILAPVGNDLYSGNCGIALFLGYLGKVTGNNDFSAAAISAINSSINEMYSLIPNHPYLVGAYNGLSGYFYTFSKLARILTEKKIDQVIWDNIELLKSLATKDKVYEVIGGTSGSLGVVLSMLKDIKCDIKKKLIIDIAYENYNHLKNNCKQFDECVAWESDVTVPSTGFSHGNAGIASYIGKLYQITNNEDVKLFLMQALAFERKLFSNEQKKWFSSLKRDRTSLGWCNGAPGILLSRLMLKNSGYEDSFINSEIDTALGTTITKGFGHNPSLCHGDLGNLEILNFAANSLNDIKLKNHCYSTFQDLFNNVLMNRWNNGVLRGTESIGLMVGVAGFGYSILRFYEPDGIPEILWFD